MAVAPQLYLASVMHKRLFPKINQFTYGVYYLALPLAKIQSIDVQHALSINRFGLLSFYEKDHGNPSEPPEEWIRNILKQHQLNSIIDDIMLICMPRVLGYVFNPVSFWLCLDKAGNIRAVLCEVNNTFGESHSYLCYHHNKKAIQPDDWLTAEKLFHVSPFLKREGSYQFRFALKDEKLGIWINFFDDQGNEQLLTSLTGELHPLSKKSLRLAAFKHPLVTLKTIYLIHWQALRLITKGIKYIAKPKQKKESLSTTSKY